MHNSYFELGGYMISIVTDSQRLQDWIAEACYPVYEVKRRPDLSITIVDGYGIPFQGFDVTVIADGERVQYKRADYLIDVDLSYHEARIQVYDTYALRHALMTLYSGFLVHNKSGLLVHSSCVVEHGGAFLFSGHSGAGKSTVARLSAPRLLLSNEATIIRIGKDDVNAYNSFAFSSDPGVFTSGSCYLREIHFLHQSSQVYRVKIPTVDALVQLLDKVFYWPHTAAEAKAVIQLVRRIVELVPAYNLYFQKNDSFWKEIC